jgi:hypothetical protein
LTACDLVQRAGIDLQCGEGGFSEYRGKDVFASGGRLIERENAFQAPDSDLLCCVVVFPDFGELVLKIAGKTGHDR